MISGIDNRLDFREIFLQGFFYAILQRDADHTATVTTTSKPQDHLIFRCYQFQ